MTPPADTDLRFLGIAHVVPDLDAAVAQYQALGFTLARREQAHLPSRTASWYTSRLEQVEAVEIHDPVRAQTLRPDWAIVDGLRRAGGGGFRLWFLVADVPAAVARLRAQGVPIGDPREVTAAFETGQAVRFQSAWVLAGHAWDPHFLNYGTRPAEEMVRRRERGLATSPWSIERLIVETPQPQADAAWLAGVLDVAVTPAEADRYRVAIPGCPLVFTAGPAGRITEVVLDGLGAPTGAVAGLRYRPATASR